MVVKKTTRRKATKGIKLSSYKPKKKPVKKEKPFSEIIKNKKLIKETISTGKRFSKKYSNPNRVVKETINYMVKKYPYLKVYKAKFTKMANEIKHFI